MIDDNFDDDLLDDFEHEDPLYEEDLDREVRGPNPRGQDLDAGEADTQDFQEQIGFELKEAQRALSDSSGAFGAEREKTWNAASDIVAKVRPVPGLIWAIIHSVYGKSGELGHPDPMAFSIVEGLIKKAAEDKTLAARATEAQKKRPMTLSAAVSIVGVDTSASLCFIHAVCRRVSNVLAERVWRPILDDALIRANIGYHLGLFSPEFGPGRGMLAGFSGRSGLAIQIASGSLDQAQEALAGLASGVEIGEVCTKVYGCDPLQVAALSLITGGCSRDIALGIAAFSDFQTDVVYGSAQHRWLAAFRVVENLRMGRSGLIEQENWKLLGLDGVAQNELVEHVKQIQRVGHGWRWVIRSLVQNSGAAED